MHDNLDSNLVWVRNLALSGKMFSANSTLIDNMMLGIPRACFPSEYAVDRLWFLLFSFQKAYAINYCTIHIIAFVGMRWFLRAFIATASPMVYNLVALAFSFLPFWPSGYLTVAGLPLLAYALMQVFMKRASIKHWTIIVIFPFCSSLLFGNLFSFPVLFLFYLIGCIQKYWTFNLRSLVPFILLFLLTAWVEQRIITLMMQGFESNRAADIQSISQFMNYRGIIGTSVRAFLLGHYHFHSLQIVIAFISVGFALWMLVRRKASAIKWPLILMAVLFFFSLTMVFLDNVDLKSVFGQSYKRIELRLWVFFPFLWYTVFAMVLIKFIEINWNKATLLILWVQIIFSMCLIYPIDYFGSRFAENVFANTWIHPNNPEQESFKNYYMINNFEQLKIGVPDIISFPLATIGVNPEILQFNGLKTIEGYYSFYPIQKRKMIQEIDSNERRKSTENLNKHSNRNYLYVHNPEKNELPDWDYNRLKAHQVKYIISDVPVKYYEEKLNLSFSASGLIIYSIK